METMSVIAFLFDWEWVEEWKSFSFMLQQTHCKLFLPLGEKGAKFVGMVYVYDNQQLSRHEI